MYREFLTPQGITNLKNHKYVAGVYSHLDNILNPYWIKMTEFLPVWLAPNMITFIGLIVLMSQSVGYALYDASLSVNQPRLLYLYSAIGVFVYQTLDALDGKQARRIGKSSPLGQFFDHGCDCIGMGFILYSFIAALRIGDDSEICYLFFLASSLAFYASNWAEFHTHVLVTSNGDFGVTEILLAIVGMNVISAIFSPNLWHFAIFGMLIRNQTLQNHRMDRIRRYFAKCRDDNVGRI